MMMKVMKTTRPKKKKIKHSCKSSVVSYSSGAAEEVNDDHEPGMSYPAIQIRLSKTTQRLFDI
jgi:hypothetical protein